MKKRRKRKSKFNWLKKARRWISKTLLFQKNQKENSVKRKRRKRSKNKPKRSLLRDLKDIYKLNFKFKKQKRRRRKRSLHKRIFLHWNKFTQNSILFIRKLFSAKKKKRRRKRKQYAVYVMSNQKKID